MKIEAIILFHEIFVYSKTFIKILRHEKTSAYTHYAFNFLL